MTDQTPIVSATVRHDGWTPARQTQFLDHLAHDGSVRAACARVGMSREAAYRLRRREALFARGWDAALVQARAVSAEALASRALDGIEEEIWYRGERVGTRRKYDSRLLLAHMARIDKIAENSDSKEDAGRFDEILAVIGGEPLPPGLECDEDGLPLDRQDHISMAIDDATEAFDEVWRGENPRADDDGESDGDGELLDPAAAQEREEREDAAHRAYNEALIEDRWNVRCAAGMSWDAWRGQAHAAVDRLLAGVHGTEDAELCTLSELST